MEGLNCWKVNGWWKALELPFFLQLLPLRFVALEFPIESWFAVYLSRAGRYLEELSLVKGGGAENRQTTGRHWSREEHGLGCQVMVLVYHSVAK